MNLYINLSIMKTIDPSSIQPPGRRDGVAIGVECAEGSHQMCYHHTKSDSRCSATGLFR